MSFLLFFLFLAFFPLKATAEEGRVSSEGSLALAVDVCSFRGDDGPYEEVVIRFPATNLAFETQGDSLFVARYVPRLELFDENGNSVKSIEGERVFSSVERIDDPEHFVYDIARFQVPAGYYHAVLDVNVVGNDRQGRAVFSIEAPEYKTGRLAFSDLFFVSEIDPLFHQFDSFRKAGHVLLPAPEREVGDGEPLRFYVALYEIGRLAHSVRFQISDRFGHVVFDHLREFPTYREDAKFVEGIPLRGLPPGTYTLRVEARAGRADCEYTPQIPHSGSSCRIIAYGAAASFDGENSGTLFVFGGCAGIRASRCGGTRCFYVRALSRADATFCTGLYRTRLWDWAIARLGWRCCGR